MKRFTCLLFLVLFLLPACGKVLSAPETTAETTVEIITEAPAATDESTTVFVPTVGEIKWRIVDLAQDWELKSWLEQMFDQRIEEASYWKEDHSIELSPGKIVSIEDWKVVLKEGSKETLLLQGQEVETNIKAPCLRDRIDERYFIFHWGGYGWLGEIYIYDTVAKKEISFDGAYSCDYWLRDGALYLFLETDAGDEDGPYPAVPHLYKADLAQLKTGGPIKTIDMLEGIPRDKVCDYGCLLSENSRYYWIASDKGLLLFDLKEKTVQAIKDTAQLGLERLDRLVEKDATTFFCHDAEFNTALELTLPK